MTRHDSREVSSNVGDCSSSNEETACLPECRAAHAELWSERIQRLADDYTAQSILVREGFPNSPLHRFREIAFSMEGVGGAPQQWVTTSTGLIQALRQLSDPTPESVLHTARARRAEHLTEWGPEGLNEFNTRFYSSIDSYAKLPRLYTADPTVAEAFARWFDRLLPDGDVYVAEWCAGAGTLKRWAPLFDLSRGRRMIHLTLSDGSYPKDFSVQSSPQEGVVVVEDYYDLLSTETAPSTDRLSDLILVAYGLDSIWFPGDIGIVKAGGRWWQELRRFSVLDIDPLRNTLLSAFAQKSSTSLSADDFSHIVLERAYVPYEVDPDSLVGRYLMRTYPGESSGRIELPGGIVTKIEDVVTHQLRPGGKLIVADVGPYGVEERDRMGDIDTCCAAIAKAIDFELAELMLRERGLAVAVTPLSELFKEYGGGRHGAEDWHELLGFQYVMTVEQRATTSGSVHPAGTREKASIETPGE
jgi:hypothetical protein